MNDIIVVDESLIADCIAIYTEGVFNSRWELIICYHSLGSRIVNDEHFVWNARGNGATLASLSKSVGIHERDLYRAIQFYNKFPNLDMVPEGKNVSWNKIVTKYLPEPTESPPPPAEYCPACGRKMI